MTKRILIADDHYVVQMAVFMILKEAFTDLFTDFASTYDEVKEKTASGNFDLIILDIVMPGSIYKAMIKELRTIQKDILILIFTSYEDDIALQYYEAGTNGFLNKLSTPNELILAIEEIFQKGHHFTQNIINQILEKK